MTKRDIVVRISNETGLTQNEVTAIVQKTLDHLADEIAAGKTVELREFGVFEVKVRKARVGRNPRKPAKDIAIPEKSVVKFRSGRLLKARVSKLAASKAMKARPVVKSGAGASKPTSASGHAARKKK